MSVRSTRPLHRIGAKANGPACPDPDCGATKSHRMASGWTADEQFVRYRQCYGCGTYFGTIEVPIPEGTTFYRLDESGRLYRRERYRRRHGKGGKPMVANQWPSDQLRVKVSVVKGERQWPARLAKACVDCGKVRHMKRNQWAVITHKDAYRCRRCMAVWLQKQRREAA